MIIITQHGHASFRSEEIEYVAQVPSDETTNSLNFENRKFSNKVNIGFKSGTIVTVMCKDTDEASQLFKDITNAMNRY